MPITEFDRQHACNKWIGRTNDGRRTAACDAEFFSKFSSKQVDRNLLTRFAVVNGNGIHPSGGYSIIRRFVGGVEAWTPRIAAFLEDTAGGVRNEHGCNPGEARQHVCALIEALATMTAQNRRQRDNRLGISAASKILFFACPEIPFFIYDKLVRERLDVPHAIDGRGYGLYWDRCQEELTAGGHIETGLPDAHENWPGYPPQGWLLRRCLDLSLYPMPGRE